MSIQHLIAAADIAVLGGLAAPAVADASVAVGAVGIGTGRLVPTVAAVVGLISLVLAWLALARSAGRPGTGNSRRMAVTAGLAGLAGLVSAVVGGLALVNAAGGAGTGNGWVAAVAAVAVGPIGMALAWLALARSRRASRTS